MVTRKGTSLVVVAIGPVQHYISQARRTHDLWTGSHLLSYLARKGVEEAEKTGGRMLYPVKLDGGRWPTSIPNRFAYEFDDDAAGSARQVEKVIRKTWQEIANEARKVLEKNITSNPWKNTWDRHIRNWLEVYWVVVPEEEGIEVAYRAMASRKLLRHFPDTGEPGEKCSLCGERQALHPDDQSRAAVRQYWQGNEVEGKKGLVHQVQNPALLRRGEWLCAVCTTKRFAHEVPEIAGKQKYFPSTSSIACITFKVDVLRHWEEMRDVVEVHCTTLKDLRLPGLERFPYLKKKGLYRYEHEPDPVKTAFLSLDGDFFYPDTFREARIREYLGEESDQNLQDKARKTLDELLKKTRSIGIAPPHTYLALLAMDGDNMGDAVRAASVAGRAGDLSQALAYYAENQVYQIIEREYPGRVIYSGGDDVLALLPTRYVLQAADKLQLAFSKHMDEQGVPNMHASAGIALFHHTHPLGQAVEAAREAERRAKQIKGKNAVFVDAIRRSGERQTMGMRWAYSAPSLMSISKMQEAFAREDLSRRLPYDLDNLAYAMDGQIVPPDARRAELHRILTRRVNPQKDVGAIVNAHEEPLFILAEQKDVGWQTLAAWIRLARFLSQEGMSE